MVTRRDLTWCDGAACRVDLREFDRARAGGPGRRARRPERVLAHGAAALAAYRGELLPGLYDDWTLGRREELAQRVRGALRPRHRRRAAHRALGRRAAGGPAPGRAGPARRGGPPPADPAAGRAAATAPGAMRTFHHCAGLLLEELGIEPDAATRRLVADLVEPPPAARRADAGARRGSHPAGAGGRGGGGLRGPPGRAARARGGTGRRLRGLGARRPRGRRGGRRQEPARGRGGPAGPSPRRHRRGRALLRRRRAGSPSRRSRTGWRTRRSRPASRRCRRCGGPRSTRLVPAPGGRHPARRLARGGRRVAAAPLLPGPGPRPRRHRPPGHAGAREPAVVRRGDPGLPLLPAGRRVPRAAAASRSTGRRGTCATRTTTPTGCAAPAPRAGSPSSSSRRSTSPRPASWSRRLTGREPSTDAAAGPRLGDRRLPAVRRGGGPARGRRPGAEAATDLDAVLRARFEQLGPAARQVAGLAAATGRDFDLDLLCEASDLDAGRGGPGGRRAVAAADPAPSAGPATTSPTTCCATTAYQLVSPPRPVAAAPPAGAGRWRSCTPDAPTRWPPSWPSSTPAPGTRPGPRALPPRPPRWRPGSSPTPRRSGCTARRLEQLAGLAAGRRARPARGPHADRDDGRRSTRTAATPTPSWRPRWSAPIALAERLSERTSLMDALVGLWASRFVRGDIVRGPRAGHPGARPGRAPAPTTGALGARRTSPSPAPR